MKKILFFSSLYKDKEVLEVTLPSWMNLNTANFQMDYLLYDDNKQKGAVSYMQQFESDYKEKVIIERDWLTDAQVYKNHNWTTSNIDRVIHIKNKAIDIALSKNYDYIFLVDADLVLHPYTLTHLVQTAKDFVFEVFWTVFTDQTYAKPNCWDVHSWDYKYKQTIYQLKQAGTYKVGAGGACTLISKEALQRGVNFNRISNMPFAGEDRHICTRADVLGIDIYVDTHYPAFHIFKNNQSKEALQWFQNGCSREYFDSWLDENWKNQVAKLFENVEVIPPKNQIERYRKALYRAKRAFINYLRYN